MRLNRFYIVAFIAAQADVLAGQESRGSAISVGLGINQSAQRITAASPYRYTGLGPRGAIGYDRWSPRSAFGLSLSIATATLRSDITQGDFPRQRFASTLITARYDRQVGKLLRGRWSVGGDLSTRAELAEHSFSAQYDADYFDFVAIRLGPVVRGTWSIGRSTITNEFVVPLISAVDFPWSNSRSSELSIDLELASPNAVRSFDNVLRFRRGAGSRLTWVYGFSYLNHREGQPVRVARQSLSLAVAFRRRGAMR